MSTASPIPPGAEATLQAWVDDPDVKAFLQAKNWKEAFARYKYLEIPEPPPFARLKKPLKEASVVAITSGGLYIDGAQAPFEAADVYGDAGIRTIPNETPYSRLKIAHDHYDHAVPEQDLHTIDPVEHLNTLQEQGFIGSLYPVQISVHGYIPVWTRVFERLAPAMLNQLHGQAIDAALLVPV